MMATKVSDGELAARLRQRNRINSERRRVKLVAGGKVQLLAWIPATLRSEIAALAAANGETVSAVVERLLSDAIRPGHAATLRDAVQSALDGFRPPERPDDTARGQPEPDGNP